MTHKIACFKRCLYMVGMIIYKKLLDLKTLKFNVLLKMYLNG